jgi:hypothetical protein
MKALSDEALAAVPELMANMPVSFPSALLRLSANISYRNSLRAFYTQIRMCVSLPGVETAMRCWKPSSPERSSSPSLKVPSSARTYILEPFMEDHMMLVVPASHDWANQEIEPDDLTSQPLLMREFGSGSRRVVAHALASIGLKPKDLQILMELDSTEGLLSAWKPASVSLSFLAGPCATSSLSALLFSFACAA